MQGINKRAHNAPRRTTATEAGVSTPPDNSLSPIAEALRHFDALPDAANVRVSVVAPLYGCSTGTIWRWAKEGRIPAPKKLSAKVTGWNVGELRRALAAV